MRTSRRADRDDPVSWFAKKGTHAPPASALDCRGPPFRVLVRTVRRLQSGGCRGLGRPEAWGRPRGERAALPPALM